MHEQLVSWLCLFRAYKKRFLHWSWNISRRKIVEHGSAPSKMILCNNMQHSEVNDHQLSTQVACTNENIKFQAI